MKGRAWLCWTVMRQVTSCVVLAPQSSVSCPDVSKRDASKPGRWAGRWHSTRLSLSLSATRPSVRNVRRQCHQQHETEKSFENRAQPPLWLPEYKLRSVMKETGDQKLHSARRKAMTIWICHSSEMTKEEREDSSQLPRSRRQRSRGRFQVVSLGAVQTSCPIPRHTPNSRHLYLTSVRVPIWLRSRTAAQYRRASASEHDVLPILRRVVQYQIPARMDQ